MNYKNIRGKQKNMINNKLNFFIGIFCLACFIINIVNHRDLFVICLTGISAFINIAIGVKDDRTKF